MFYFRDPGHAPTAALEMLEGLAGAGLPPAHVGIHAGPVLFQQGDYFGQTVNLSARIADYARAGEVLVSREAAERRATSGSRSARWDRSSSRASPARWTCCGPRDARRDAVPHTPVMDGSTASPLVIVNANASQLTDPARRERVTSSLLRAVESRTGRAPVLVDSTPEAARAALADAADAPLVAVAGGDGTIREASAALAGSGVPLAIVPAGTGNVFASALGIPRQAARRSAGSRRPGSTASTWARRRGASRVTRPARPPAR